MKINHILVVFLFVSLSLSGLVLGFKTGLNRAGQTKSISIYSTPYSPPNEYEVFNYRVIDGDTLEVDIYLGLDVSTKKTIRINGVNTPELRSPDSSERKKANKAKKFVEKLLSDADKIYLMTKGESGKYGRTLGDISIYKDEAFSLLSEQLITNKLGKVY